MALTETFVRAWVENATRVAGLPSLAESMVRRVQARLAKGAETYGPDNYLEVAFEELVREIGEEADDLMGWSVAASARLFADDSIRVSSQAQQRLAQIAAYGAQARAEADALTAELRRR